MVTYNKKEQELMDKFTEFQKACRNNRVFPECEFIEIFEQNISKLKILIPKETLMYRARIFRDELMDRYMNILEMINEAKSPEDFRYAENVHQEFQKQLKYNADNGFNGYDEKNSFVNKNKEYIKAARCNHDFEICLYTAEEINTSISELKPLIGETISVASIKTLEDLDLIDLTFVFETKGDELAFLRNLIALLFIESPTENKKDAYIYTQVICSIVKKCGYDGIKYSSCQSVGKANYAIFNYEKCKAVGSERYSVKNINYGIEQL